VLGQHLTGMEVPVGQDFEDGVVAVHG